MADAKIQNSAGGEITTLNGTEVLPTPRLSNTTDYFAYIGSLARHVCQGRLTLTSGTPVTTADVTGATNVYFTPYKGNLIALYDGTRWQLLSFTELTLALGTITSGLPYDVFAYINSNAVAVELLAWTNATTRATALTTQDGVLSKTGVLTRRYLGTFVTTATTTTEDSVSKRYLWNYYNRVPRKLVCKDSTNSWAYTTASYREVQAGSTYGTSRVGLCIGYSEDIVTATAITAATSSSGNTYFSAGIGLDNATNATDINIGMVTSSLVSYSAFAFWRGYPGVGSHYLAWLELGGSNITMYGDNGGTALQTGMVAEVMA